jgi:hypothetical protein
VDIYQFIKSALMAIYLSNNTVKLEIFLLPFPTASNPKTKLTARG